MNDGLQVLGPRHHAAIRLKLDGASGREIADALDVQTRTVYLWMGDPLVKEELARQLDRIGDVFAREIALAANTAITELRKMAELPIDGPLEATEKLSCIQEILDRSLPAAPVMPEIQPAERELASLSEAELVARATELLTGLAQPPSTDRKPGSSYSPRRSLGGCLCRARPEAARVVLLSFVPSESVRGVSADACKSS